MSEAAEGYRVSQVIHRRYAVFPAVADLPAKEVDRPRLQEDGMARPTGGRLSAKAETAPGQTRNADNIFKNRLVPMPADRRSRTIFRDQNVRKVVRRQTGESGRPFAKMQQEAGYPLRTIKRASAEIVMPAEGGRTPFTKVARSEEHTSELQSLA